jgi:hypothetical protein
MAHGWGGMAALGQSPPSASRGCSCAAPLVLAACCTPARVCISLSFVLAARCPIVCTRLSRRPSAALVAFESVTPEQLQPCRLPVPSHPSCPCAAVRAGGLPAGIQRWPATGAGRAGRSQARAAAGRVAAGWHGVGGRGRWKRPFDFPIPSVPLWEGDPNLSFGLVVCRGISS